MKKNNYNELSTYDQFMQDPKQKKLFDKDYNKFLLKELLLEAMNENNITVRKLSEQSGVSTSIIQNIKTEKTNNITFNTVNSLMTTLGYRIIIEKNVSNKKNKKISFTRGEKSAHNTA